MCDFIVLHFISKFKCIPDEKVLFLNVRSLVRYLNDVSIESEIIVTAVFCLIWPSSNILCILSAVKIPTVWRMEFYFLVCFPYS